MSCKQVVIKLPPSGAARSFFARLKGLIGSASPGEGLLIEPCNSIHTFFMRYAIDAVFYDKNHKVVAVHRNLKPWRISKIIPAARGVLELPSGAARDMDRGDKLVVVVT